MFKVKIMSRRELEEYALADHRNRSIVISITSRGEAFIPEMYFRHLECNILTCYRAVFNDSDSESDGMSPIQALEIAEFIRKYKDRVDQIIVQCGAGQSRSAGIAAAILKWSTGNDNEIFNSRKYTPNMRCYRLTLEALTLNG